MGDLVPNFNRSEFACHDGCGLDSIDSRTVKVLQKLRDQLGKPIMITSGCRCPRHNAAVGGAPDSQHLASNGCTASDINIRDMSPAQVADYVEANIPEFANGGIGRYPGWTHVDLGPKRRWGS